MEKTIDRLWDTGLCAGDVGMCVCVCGCCGLCIAGRAKQWPSDDLNTTALSGGGGGSQLVTGVRTLDDRSWQDMYIVHFVQLRTTETAGHWAKRTSAVFDINVRNSFSSLPLPPNLPGHVPLALHWHCSSSG